MAALQVIGLDHLVLRVADAERSLAFYSGLLGLEPVRLQQWRAGRAPFPSVRIDPTTIIDLVESPGTGVNVDHICLVLAPTDLTETAADPRLSVIDGPGPRFGAQGTGQSLYVRDPDGTVVELRCYPDANRDPGR